MTYDANGNTLSDGMNTYVWDARNRLVSADNNGASFSYDPLGRRVAKTVMSTTTNFVYDGVNPVQEFGTNPTASLLTGGVDERFQRTSATETDNYLTDALGSTVALTDATGATQVQYSYSPYGSQSATGSTTNSYTYTGREFDGLGINYYRARYYNPATGRFLSEDPSGFRGGINLYAYAGNNPMSFTDPFGLDKNSRWGGGGWGGGNGGNPGLTALADALGIYAAVSGNTPLGWASSATGVGNNPSVPNILLTAEANLIPLVVEGSEVPIAVGFAAYDAADVGSDFVVNQVVAPILESPQPDEPDICSGLGGNGC